MSLIKHQGKDFLNVFTRSQGTGMWYTWVYLLGSEMEAAQYKFTFSIKLSDKDKHGLVFSSTVSSVDVPFNDVIKGGSVGCFTDFVARTVWDEKTNRMNFKLQVSISSTFKRLFCMNVLCTVFLLLRFGFGKSTIALS